jgi:hypothetical protein
MVVFPPCRRRVLRRAWPCRWTTGSIVIDVLPQPRRPLRAEADADPQEFLALETPTVLFALASCDATFDAASVIARKLITAWVDHLRLSGRSEVSFRRAENHDDRVYCDQHSGPLTKGEQWARIIRELPSLSWFGVRRKQSMQSDGFEFGVVVAGRRTRTDPQRACISLALWKNVSRTKPELEDDRKRLVDLVEEFMRGAAGIQAVMGRWDSSPDLGRTAYEQACGQSGGEYTTSRVWQTRFLRGVTEDWMWLGKDLLKRLEGARAISRLEDISTVVSIRDGIRFRLRPNSSLDELEQVLATLLPTKATWTTAMQSHK